MSAEPGEWEAIFRADPNPAVQDYGKDSAWPLFDATVKRVEAIEPRPKLIVLTGDILPHKFQERFAAASGGNDASAFQAFEKKTVAFIGMELEKAAAGVPFVYTLGNNDEECGDYALEPHGPFLAETQGMVEKLAHLNASELAGWSTLGNYVTRNPLARHHRIIALNSNFWSRRYTNSCGSPAEDPGAEVMTWLSDQLKDARKHGDKVWLVYHIPPGIDGHSSSRTNQVVPMWKPQYADGFNRLLDEYRNTIELNLAGHTHLDDVRLVQTAHVTTLVLLNPGVSPNVGQNPAYRIIKVDSHARVKDMDTYWMPSFNGFEWKLEYSARKAYGLRAIDAASYQKLYDEMDRKPELAQQWKQFYSVSRLAGLSDKKAYIRSLYCAAGHADPDSFEACLKAAQ